MYYAHEDTCRHNARILADAQRQLLAGRARKLRKRDGSSEYAEAGDHRPPAVDC